MIGVRSCFRLGCLPRGAPRILSSSSQHDTHCEAKLCFSTNHSSFVDLRSDTLTMPSKEMIQAGAESPLGDDVFGEDPTVLQLEECMADLFGKEKGLYVPTGTMANLVAILSHCHTRASEAIIGQGSHIHLWEGGGSANVGGVSTAQLPEDENGRLNPNDIRDSFRSDVDDHWPESKLICLENTHNMAGGIALPCEYMDEMGGLAHDELDIKVHVDGARIFNATIATGVTPERLCKNVDSVSICLSKGLGAPVGSVLVGDTEFIRRAKRARKRCGGGMRQAGVVAGMGLYAVHHNVQRLQEDHTRAQRLGKALHENGFHMFRGGQQVDTNCVYFSLPEDSPIRKEDLVPRLQQEYGVKLGGGYSKAGKMFRAVTHMHIDDSGIDRAIEGIVSLGCRGR